jgi:hypothetical protein
MPHGDIGSQKSGPGKKKLGNIIRPDDGSVKLSEKSGGKNQNYDGNEYGPNYHLL